MSLCSGQGTELGSGLCPAVLKLRASSPSWCRFGPFFRADSKHKPILGSDLRAAGCPGQVPPYVPVSSLHKNVVLLVPLGLLGGCERLAEGCRVAELLAAGQYGCAPVNAASGPDWVTEVSTSGFLG